MVGGKGDDFLYVGNDGFKFNLATTSSGADEFPFKNDSPGSSEIQIGLKDGVFTLNGSYKDFVRLHSLVRVKELLIQKRPFSTGQIPSH